MFSPRALGFLRSLRRHNDRDWFRARRAEYERLLRGPMLELIARMDGDLRRMAPELEATPRSLYRIYRDTRFSENKTPLKTHVAAIFPCRGLPKHEGAGLYLEVSPDRVLLAGGLYAPTTAQLHAVRVHLRDHTRSFLALIRSPAFRRVVGEVQGDRLQRMPRGFDPAHPAAEYLKLRQYLAFCERPAAFATSPGFYAGVVRVFRAIAPLVRFLNAPLRAATRPAPSS